jgi:four helix bundle protein
MAIRSYSDLLVWQKPMELTVDVYQLTSAFPRDETFGLSSQLRRSAVSVASNIAEGHGRSGTREFQRFLNMARGSVCEVQTQIEVANRVGLGDPTSVNHAIGLSHEVGKLLYLLLKSLKKKAAGT